jgi:hypothetical protein
LVVCAALWLLAPTGAATAQTGAAADAPAQPDAPGTGDMGTADARPAPERRVEESRVVSDADPAIEVRVPEGAIYLGARRILIDERFDAELHVFAEVDAFGMIERFYWIQFEEYLPDAPGRYDYRQSNPETVSIDGVEMHVRPGGENTAESTIRPGSDYEAFRALVDEAGYRLPTWLSTLRLVHLYEPTERGELIVIYGEGPDALAEAAAEAMMAGEPGLVFADMLADLIADVDARVDLTPRGPDEAAD